MAGIVKAVSAARFAMIEKLEEFLRQSAQKARLEAQKRKAQRERVTEGKAVAALDNAMQNLSDIRVGESRKLFRLEQALLQRQAKSRGFLRKDAEGIWGYDNKKVDRDDRPAEKLVKGDLNSERWARVKDAVNDARATHHYATEHYEKVVMDDYREGALADGGIGQHKYSEWRNMEIERGIEEGFIKRRSSGAIQLVNQGSTRNRPAEKLVTRKIRVRKQENGPWI